MDRHKLTVFYLKSFDMDSVQVGKAVFGKEIHTTNIGFSADSMTDVSLSGALDHVYVRRCDSVAKSLMLRTSSRYYSDHDVVNLFLAES